MFVSKSIIESVLPENLKELMNDSNIENLNCIAESLQHSLEQVKHEINVLKETSSDKIEPEIKKSENFITQINCLHNQIDKINLELDQQESLLKNVSQIEEYKNLIDHIETINKVVIIFESLRDYELNLSDLKYSIDNKNYTHCYDVLNTLNRITNESNLFKVRTTNIRDSNENLLKTDEILIIKDLREELVVQRERLWFELDIEWDNMIKIDSNCIQIDTIKTNQNFLNQLTQFSSVKPSQIDQISFVFASKLKNFSKIFLNLVETKIVNSKFMTQIETKQDTNIHYFNLNETNDQTNIETSQLLNLKLDQILKLFNFVYDNFFKLKVYVSKNETKSLMSLFENLTSSQFSKLIYESLIVNILPLNEFDFNLKERFDQVLIKFEESLKSLECSTNVLKDSRALLTGLEEMYARKKCKSIMQKARSMMKDKDLIFELISTDETSVNFKEFKNNKLINDLLMSQQRLSDPNPEIFKIPKSLISKFAFEFMKLIDETLMEAHTLSKQNDKSLKSVSLFCLVTRNLFDLYSSVIPTYYSSSLKDLPKLSAIVFNDFYYLSLNCLTLGHKFKSLIRQLKMFSEFRFVDVQDLISNFNYVELAPNLYMIGYEILANQIQNQEKNLIQFLNEDCPNGIKDISESNNYDMFKKTLQKCIFQLNNLSSMWHGVLNESLLKKIMGQLIDLVLNDLVKSCIRLDDISSDDASYLHSAFSLMTQAVYELYSRNETNLKSSDNVSNDLVDLSLNSNLADLEASKYVSNWQKFKYILAILKASLQEIVDLWTDGKGPLAMHFEADEIRHLIKALFMNTDRRQAALARIR